MPRRTISLAVIGIASLAMLAGAARTILDLPTRPPIVATVDLERLFNNLDVRQAGEDRVSEIGSRFDTQLEELRGRIESLQADLENFEQGGEDWLRINDTVQSTISEYRAIEQYAQLKIEAERSKAMKGVYETIKNEIASFAAAQTPPIDFVLIDDTIPELEPSTADAMLKQISARRMVYATSQFDITDAVLARMNGRGG
jgi:Skp family chaperone for outer membrane proteins